MFAPPPVQFSRVEIQARLAAKREQSGKSETAKGVGSAASSPTATSLHSNESRSPILSRKNVVFRKKRDKGKEPVAVHSSSEAPRQHAGIVQVAAEGSRKLSGLPTEFGECPRPAPVPPIRSTRPPEDFWQRSLPGPRPPPPTAPPPPPTQHGGPPPVPERSPRRQVTVSSQLGTAQSLSQQPVSVAQSLDIGLKNLHIEQSSTMAADGRLDAPAPSLTSPIFVDRQQRYSVPNLDAQGVIRPKTRKPASVSFVVPGARTALGSRASAKLSSVKGGKVDKTVAMSKRPSKAASIHAALMELDESLFFGGPSGPLRRATDGDTRRKGETLSQLLETSFFPDQAAVRDSNIAPVNTAVQFPPPISCPNNDLPDTPTSIVPTPTEMYHGTPPRPSRPIVRKERLKAKKRSPLAQVSTTSAKANSTSPLARNEEMSPTRLSAIPELSTTSENTPLPSGATSPVATEIHLRGGSVLTLSPPELTAWKQSLYVQGPIKLPKPVVVPRKDSVASLEPFQDAIDQVYQEALNISRRRSDDAVVDEVCDFFDDFGFDEVRFEGDSLLQQDTGLDDEGRDPDQDMASDIERFSTPPAEPTSPVEKVVAKEVIETMSYPALSAQPHIPPVENEETLRAKGIARLSHGVHQRPAVHSGRKDSLTLSRVEATVLPLLPLPEEGILEAVVEGDTLMADPVVDRGFDVEEDVEELDKSSTWVAPAAIPRRHGMTRTPQRSGKKVRSDIVL